MSKPRVFVEVSKGRKTINFNYPKDKAIAETIWGEIQVPLIKCQIDISGYVKINGKNIEEVMRGMETAKAKLLSHPFLNEVQRSIIENIWLPESESNTRPVSLNTKLTRNLRPVVNFLTSEHYLTEKEATEITFSILQGWFPNEKEVQSIKLESFQRTMRK